MALPKLYEQITWVNDMTPALNEDNLNAMSQALDDIDDRVIDLAGTIMEDVPQIQEDMEILGPAVENIDENVARAEAAADSAEQYAEEIAPPIEVVKDFAPIITIEDAINKAAKDVKVKVDAVQNLHGYSKPWVGGAGKNLSFESSGNNKVIAHLKSGVTYTFSLKLASGRSVGLVLRENSNTGAVIKTAEPYVGGITFTASGDIDLYLNGYSLSTGTFAENTSEFQVEVGQTATAYEPYTNICPITGHSEVKVTRAGKNLFDVSQNEEGGIDASGVEVTGNTQRRSSNYIPCKPNGTFTLSCKDAGIVRLYFYDANKTFISPRYQGDSGVITATAPANARFMRWVYYNFGSVVTEADVIAQNMMIEAGSARTDYEPFVALDTFTISLGDTRYGGVLDVDAGTLTIDKVGVDLGSLTWTTSGTATSGKPRMVCSELASVIKKPASDNVAFNGISSLYTAVSNNATYNNIVGVGVSASSGNLFVYDDRYTSSSDFTTAVTGQTLVYELATPETITLTAEEVTLLWAYNTLWADTGDIALTYDASGVLRIANAKLDIDTFKSIVAASSDFADFKSRVAAL